jgi:hypothetical protein
MSAHTERPSRRSSESFDLDFYGMRDKVTVGPLPVGSLIEVFIANHNAGGASDVAARDAGIVPSFLLQNGCPVEAISRVRVLSRNSDGSASGVAAAVHDGIAEARR